MSSLKRRLDELERRLDAGARPILLRWPRQDGKVEVDGQLFETRDEARRYCRAHDIPLPIWLDWPEKQVAENE